MPPRKRRLNPAPLSEAYKGLTAIIISHPMTKYTKVDNRINRFTKKILKTIPPRASDHTITNRVKPSVPFSGPSKKGV